MLIKVKGDEVLLKKALQYQPSLLIDCTNCANPHRLYPYATEQELANVLMIPTESLYRFRNAILQLPMLAKTYNVKAILLTSFHKLFDYNDKVENESILNFAWEQLEQLSKDHLVFVGQKSDYASENSKS